MINESNGVLVTESTAPTDISPLLTPFSIGALRLRNRFVMAPMTRVRSHGGVPGPEVAAYYQRRAAGGVGLIITEGTFVDHPSAGNSMPIPHMNASTVPAWTEVTRAAHADGAAIFCQLWHLGAQTVAGETRAPETPALSPSGLDSFGNATGRAMTDSDIADTISAYARSAAWARQAGFDGVELHGAHGYLIDAFFWDRTNQRKDKYGGQIAARGTFAAAVVAGIRAAVGPDFPVVLRFSQWKYNQYDERIVHSADDLEKLLGPVVEAGVTMFHPSVRRYWEPAFAGSDRTLSGWTKVLFALPTITVGSVGLSTLFLSDRSMGGPASHSGISTLLERFAADEFDLVAVGRALVSDPQWVQKVAEGRIGELVGFSPEVVRDLL